MSTTPASSGRRTSTEHGRLARKPSGRVQSLRTASAARPRSSERGEPAPPVRPPSDRGWLRIHVTLYRSGTRRVSDRGFASRRRAAAIAPAGAQPAAAASDAGQGQARQRDGDGEGHQADLEPSRRSWTRDGLANLGLRRMRPRLLRRRRFRRVGRPRSLPAFPLHLLSFHALCLPFARRARRRRRAGRSRRSRSPHARRAAQLGALRRGDVAVLDAGPGHLEVVLIPVFSAAHTAKRTQAACRESRARECAFAPRNGEPEAGLLRSEGRFGGT